MARTPRQPDAPNPYAQTYSPLAGAAPIAFDRTPAGQATPGSTDSPYMDEAGNYLPGVVSPLAGPVAGETPQQVWFRERLRQRAIADANQTPGYRADGPWAGANGMVPLRDSQLPGAPAAASSSTSSASTLDQSGRDAYARLQSVLDDYGLGSLAATIQGWLVEGLSEAEITQRMRDTPEFRTRFPAIEARKKAGLAPISPGEYVAYERQASQLMRAAGLPQGFHDSPDDFTKYLVNDTSLSELGDRITGASQAMFSTPADVLAEFGRFGASAGDLTAYWLNPDVAEPLIQRKYGAARLSAAAGRTGFGSLSEGEATGLLQQGVSESAATSGFGTLADSKELFNPLDSGEDVIARQDQMDAVFGGNAAAERRIKRRARRRQSAFEGSTDFATGQTGVVGLGSGPRV